MRYINRREFTLLGVSGCLAMFFTPADKCKQIKVSKNNVLDTVFHHIEFACGRAPVYSGYYYNTHFLTQEKKIGRFLFDDAFKILVPMICFVSKDRINKQAIDLLVVTARNSTKPVYNPTHEVDTDDGVVQINLSDKSQFVFITQGDFYGLMVLGTENICMKQ